MGLSFRRPRLLVAAALTLPLALVGCGSGGGGDSAGGPAEIVIGSSSEPNSLDPQVTNDRPAFPVTWRIFEGLTDFDAEGNLVPLLAAELPTSVNDTTWEVKLRPDVTFSDGTPFNADAVVFSLERIISEEIATTIQEAATIKGAEKVNDLTVRIKTHAVDPLLPYELRAVKMVPPGKVDFPEQVIGTGPYLLESYDQGGDAVLVRNADYWGGEPEIEKVTIRFIPDPNTRLQALQAGELDLMLGLNSTQESQADKTLSTSNGVASGFVRINTYKDNFSDPEVRRALNMAIDKDAIGLLFGGYADPANCQPTPPQAFGTNPDLEPIPYDPDAAKQVIEDAGLAGEEVLLSWPNGFFPLDRELGQVVADYLTDAGLDVRLKSSEFNVWFKDILKKGAEAPDLVFTESDNGLNDTARQVDQYYTVDGAVSAFGNEEIDALAKEAKSTLDPEERAAIDRELLAKACEEAPLIYLYFRKELYGASDRLEYSPRPDLSEKLYYDEMSVSD